MQQVSDTLTDFEKKLIAMGYPYSPDIEESPQAICAECDDTGMYRKDVPVGHPDFGRMYECTNPDCPTATHNRQNRWARQLNDTTLGIDYARYYLDAWEANLTSDQLKGKLAAFYAACLFVESPGRWVSRHDIIRSLGKMPSPDENDAIKNSLIISGAMGVGKTALAGAIINELVRQGEAVRYGRAKAIIDHIQDGYRDDSEVSAREIERMYIDMPVLVIDEFDLNNITDSRLDLIEDLIRQRLASDRPTIITTNLDQNALTARWGGRTSDPLIHKSHWIKMGGVSLRRKDEPIGD